MSDLAQILPRRVRVRMSDLAQILPRRVRVRIAVQPTAIGFSGAIRSVGASEVCRYQPY